MSDGHSARLPLFWATAERLRPYAPRFIKAHRHNNVRLFLNDQLDKDDKQKRQRLRKDRYSRSDYYRLGRD
jgi:hypothetical protein